MLLLDSCSAMLDDSGVAGISLLDSGAVSDENAGVLDEDVADVSSAGPELLESEEHAKKTALAIVTVIRDAASFWSIL